MQSGKQARAVPEEIVLYDLRLAVTQVTTGEKKKAWWEQINAPGGEFAIKIVTDLVVRAPGRGFLDLPRGTVARVWSRDRAGREPMPVLELVSGEDRLVLWFDPNGGHTLTVGPAVTH